MARLIGTTSGGDGGAGGAVGGGGGERGFARSVRAHACGRCHRGVPGTAHGGAAMPAESSWFGCGSISS
eukprot:scaffold8363_cov91-Isochrysis_galbana.AAC.3